MPKDKEETSIKDSVSQSNTVVIVLESLKYLGEKC